MVSADEVSPVQAEDVVGVADEVSRVVARGAEDVFGVVDEVAGRRRRGGARYRGGSGCRRRGIVRAMPRKIWVSPTMLRAVADEDLGVADADEVSRAMPRRNLVLRLDFWIWDI